MNRSVRQALAAVDAAEVGCDDVEELLGFDPDVRVVRRALRVPELRQRTLAALGVLRLAQFKHIRGVKVPLEPAATYWSVAGSRGWRQLPLTAVTWAQHSRAVVELGDPGVLDAFKVLQDGWDDEMSALVTAAIEFGR